MIEIFIWILLTLGIVAITGLLAKKYGPEYIIGMYAAMVVIANILANKIVMFFGWAIDAGTIIYPATFLLTDILVELYGKKIARKAVWVGFLANLMLVVSVWIAVRWPAAPFYEYQEAFSIILGNTGRIVIASIIAFIISQNNDVWMYDKLKKLTKGKHLWFRNNISTMTSHIIDTIIFSFIAFLGIFPLYEIIIGQLILKFIITLIDTPFLYLVVYLNKSKKAL